MNTIIDTITDDIQHNNEIIDKAAGIIASGGLVAFPTETVYGLGGDAFDATAARRIYEAKGRPSDNPLIVHISQFEDIYKLCDEVPESAVKLAKVFWPGPLTMIVNKNASVPLSVTGGLQTVAVRLPSDEVARQLIAKSGTFIAAPSANISGRPSPTRAKHVIEDMDGRIQMIIDGGDIEIGVESTIIDLTEEIPVVLRPGYITLTMLSEVLGEVKMDPGLTLDASVKPKAPGMKYRHYAPKASLTIVEGDTENVIATIKALTDKDIENGLSVGIMTTSEHQNDFAGTHTLCLGKAGDEEAIAKHLFAALREFDDLKVDRIYSEAFSSVGVGQAVMNRLLKAAGHTVINV